MDLPIEVRVLIVCASMAALVVAASQGIIIAAVAAALYLVIIGLTGGYSPP